MRVVMIVFFMFNLSFCSVIKTQIMKDIVLPDIYFLRCEIIVVRMQEKEE